MRRVAIDKETAQRQFDESLTKLKAVFPTTKDNLEYTYEGKTGLPSMPLSEWAKRPEAKKITFARGVVDCYNLAHELLHLLPEIKEIPPAFLKRVTAAYKEVTRTRSFNVPLWFAANQGIFNLLIEEAPRWKSVSSVDTQEVEQVGNLNLINQTKSDASMVVEVLRKAVKAIQVSDVPGLKNVLYGNVLFTEGISRKDTVVAHYDPAHDSVYVYLLKKYSEGHVASLIHEFGHRYYAKFMQPEVKSLWTQHHRKLMYAPAATPKLVPGEPLPGYPEHIVERVDFERNGGMTIILERNYSVPYSRWQKTYEQAKFPTAYSATSAEEHFCEALSLYCLGDLPPQHADPFRSIVVKGEPPLKDALLH